MLLSGSHQVLNAVSLPRVETVEAVAVTKKRWIHTERMQQILLAGMKKDCLIVWLSFFSSSEGAKSSSPIPP